MGVYLNRVTARRTAGDFAKFMGSLARKYKDAARIVVVMDNLNIHSEKSLKTG
jgi:hypothetical protein